MNATFACDAAVFNSGIMLEAAEGRRHFGANLPIPNGNHEMLIKLLQSSLVKKEKGSMPWEERPRGVNVER